jgi:NDP-sugar pyrophosphorylase family protein
MILAAGYGERLWPLTADRGKPALPVLGKPLVGYVAEYLSCNGVTEAVVNLHHAPQSVREALGDGSRFGLHLEYVFEPVILGTSGALDNARKYFEDETFIVVNGKIITDIDLRAAIKTHREKDALATLVLMRNTNRERFSVVETKNSLISRFAGMPSNEQGEAPLMFTGIHILEPRIFEYIPRGVFSDSVVHVYPKAMAAGERVAAHVGAGAWHELSTLQRYLDISLALMQREGRDVFVGEESDIEDVGDLHECVLWDKVTVERGARVSRAVIGDGVRLGSDELVQGAVIVRADLIAGKIPPAKALKGYQDDDKFVVPLSQ